MYYRQLVRNLILGFIIASSSIAYSPALSEATPIKSQVSDIVTCDMSREEPSKIRRQIQLDDFGISFNIPANYRAVAMTNGTVMIVDNGIYQDMKCFDENPNAAGQTSIEYLSVYKSSESFLYSNVYDKVPGKENVFIVWKKMPIDATSNTHEIKLRIKSKTGVIEIESILGEPIYDDSAKYVLEELLNIGRSIQIL